MIRSEQVELTDDWRDECVIVILNHTHIRGSQQSNMSSGEHYSPSCAFDRSKEGNLFSD